MFNPFKKTYQIIERKNLNGQTMFLAKFSSPFLNFLHKVSHEVPLWIDCDGGLSDCEYGFFSLENAKAGVEKHKALQIAQKNAEFKTSAIHYVE